MTSGSMLFKEDLRLTTDKGYNIGAQPSQLFWDGDRIYIATKRAYVVLDKNTGNSLHVFQIDSKGKS